MHSLRIDYEFGEMSLRAVAEELFAGWTSCVCEVLVGCLESLVTLYIRHSSLCCVGKIRRSPCYACIFPPCSDDCGCEKFVTELPAQPTSPRINLKSYLVGRCIVTVAIGCHSEWTCLTIRYTVFIGNR